MIVMLLLLTTRQEPKESNQVLDHHCGGGGISAIQMYGSQRLGGGLLGVEVGISESSRQRVVVHH
jgi:hypothetical protein